MATGKFKQRHGGKRAQGERDQQRRAESIPKETYVGCSAMMLHVGFNLLNLSFLFIRKEQNVTTLSQNLHAEERGA